MASGINLFMTLREGLRDHLLRLAFTGSGSAAAEVSGRRLPPRIAPLCGILAGTRRCQRIKLQKSVGSEHLARGLGNARKTAPVISAGSFVGKSWIDFAPRIVRNAQSLFRTLGLRTPLIPRMVFPNGSSSMHQVVRI